MKFRTIRPTPSFSWDSTRGNVRWQSFEKGDTYIVLRAEDQPAYHTDAISKADILKVAESLVKVK